ncbi:OmpA family protein [Roseovarius sp.]|jgi:chemotaxis protein MotB
MVKKVLPVPLVVDEPEEPDCPKCPPPGAPAWMATFADIATLLMAFFVLILSFAEFNQPKFKMVAGSLRNSFGIQREQPIFQQPKGTTVMDLTFSPSPDPAVIKEITQQTTDQDRPEIDRASPDGDEGTGELAAQLDQIITSDDVTIEIQDGEIVVSIAPSENAPAETPSPQEVQEVLQEVASAIAQATEDRPDLAEAVEDLRIELDAPTAEALMQAGETPENLSTAGSGATDSTGGAGDSTRSAALSEAELRVALRQEIAEGLVDIERREDSVVVTVGSGGAFASGRAALTPEARQIMSRIAFSAMSDDSRITVTGHTDDRPLAPGSEFRDNWGLAAARAAAVVREMEGGGLVDPDRLTAISRGETQPVASNATPDDRARNRRIEIEIQY